MLIWTDSLVCPAIADLAPYSCERIRTSTTTLEDLIPLLIDRHRVGKRVVRLHDGDTALYSAINEQICALSDAEIPVEVVPGISAVNAIASLVGAPLTHDYCTISLSDLLTPWPVIERRVVAASQGDFVIALYNPQSKRRTWQLPKTVELMLEHGRDPKTPTAIVKSAYRRRQDVVLTTLDDLCNHKIGMLTTGRPVKDEKQLR